MQLRLSKVKQSLAYKLIDKRIDEYITLNRKHPESSSERVSVLGRCLKRQYNNNYKGIPKTVEEGWLYDNAA